MVNRPPPEAEAQQLKPSPTRGWSVGSEPWAKKTAARLGLQYTLNPRGRPGKQEEKMIKVRSYTRCR
jgi:hypothetical protein